MDESIANPPPSVDHETENVDVVEEHI